jgi:sarcosine oxidase/L-pipecolate oxidase
MWRNDKLFKPWFHNTGRIDCAGQPDSIESLKKGYQTLVESDTDLKDSTVWLDTEEEILAKAPLLDREQIKVSIPSIAINNR